MVALVGVNGRNTNSTQAGREPGGKEEGLAKQAPRRITTLNLDGSVEAVIPGAGRPPAQPAQLDLTIRATAWWCSPASVAWQRSLWLPTDLR